MSPTADAQLRRADPPGEVGDALDDARRHYWEDPEGSLAAAIRGHERACTLDDAGLRGRAIALQGTVALHRGELRGAVALAAEAERVAGDHPVARVEVAALQAHLSFFSGSYGDALAQAEQAVTGADATGDVALRVFARRAACLVFGNVGVRDWPERLDEILALSIESGNRWEEAISRNDLGCLAQRDGDLEAAEHQLELGMAIAAELAPRNGFALGVLHSTRADVRLMAGRPDDALADAECAIAHLTASGEPNPYVFGVTVRAQVQALSALGRLDDAQDSGEGALSRLGDRVPQARSLILSTVASALREAGRVEAAYDTLARSAELERQAFRELSELQLGLQRAHLEAVAARREAEQMREQADRDWLTGLHNRRFLARELERIGRERSAGALSLAVLDLDHFKAVNDALGHDAGDRVLVRVAALLTEEIRAQDTVVRTGGEEFVILMTDTEPQAALACCERLRVAIRDEPWDRIAEGVRLTASIGVASSADPADLDALARTADRRLYAAKHAGRDRVITRDG